MGTAESKEVEDPQPRHPTPGPTPDPGPVAKLTAHNPSNPKIIESPERPFNPKIIESRERPFDLLKPLKYMTKAGVRKEDASKELSAVLVKSFQLSSTSKLGFQLKFPSRIVVRAPFDAYDQGVREGYTLHTVNAKEVPKRETEFNNMIENMQKSGQEWTLVFSRPYQARVLVNLQELSGFEISPTGVVTKATKGGQCMGKIRPTVNSRTGDQICWVGTQNDESMKWTWHRMTDWDWDVMKTHLVEGKQTQALLLFRSNERGVGGKLADFLKTLCDHGRTIMQYRAELKNDMNIEEKARVIAQNDNSGKQPKKATNVECTDVSRATLDRLWRRSSSEKIQSAQDNLIESILEMLPVMFPNGPDQKAFLEQFHRDVVLRAIVASARLWKQSAKFLSEQRTVLKLLVRASKKNKIDTATRFLILDQLGYELDEKKRGELLRMPADPSPHGGYFIPNEELCNFPERMNLEVTAASMMPQSLSLSS
jgi:hypothetical protein